MHVLKLCFALNRVIPTLLIVWSTLQMVNTLFLEVQMARYIVMYAVEPLHYGHQRDTAISVCIREMSVL